VVESFDVSPSDSWTVEESIPHLASHYYRVFLHRNVDSIRFELRPDLRNGENPLKAEVAVVLPDLSRGERKVLRPVQEADGAGSLSLMAEVSDLEGLDLHHLVLVVSNCTLEELPMDHPDPASDSYKIEISAS
jgi:hypothetical protein